MSPRPSMQTDEAKMIFDMSKQALTQAQNALIPTLDLVDTPMIPSILQNVAIALLTSAARMTAGLNAPGAGLPEATDDRVIRLMRGYGAAMELYPDFAAMSVASAEAVTALGGRLQGVVPA